MEGDAVIAVIPLSFPKPPLTHNRMPRNYAYKGRLVRGIQDEVRVRARCLTPIEVPVEIRLVWTVPDRRTRDQDGPEPTKKACIDALVKAGILAKGDSHEWVKSYCVIELGDKFAMRLEIEEI